MNAADTAKFNVKCPSCGETDTSKFAKNSARINGLQVYCKACHNNRQKNDPKRRDGRIRWNLTARYGLTVEEYSQRLADQKGVCAICNQPETVSHLGGKTIRLAVDHDHSCCSGKFSCGKCVRGLLCYRCNRMISSWKDDPIVFFRAAEYLRKSFLAKP